jgi:hypothetical protein
VNFSHAGLLNWDATREINPISINNFARRGGPIVL